MCAVTRPAGQTHGIDDAVDQLRADYDATPYTSNAFSQSAPDQLAAVAHLFGLDPPAVATARVLEIGCAAGGNVIPFAAFHPQAQVVGIDLSEVQVEHGRARIKALELDNLQLVAGDIARTNLTGPFDYIVAHGVYSWVPADVQEALLAAIRRLLAPNGVAYLSYNTYPGWKSKEILRDAMLLASGASEGPDEKVRAALSMAEFLEEVAPPDGVLARVLAESRSANEEFDDSYLLHDELETFNAPCYFYELIGRLGAHGLAYLAEARPETMIPGNFGPKVEEQLLEKCGGVQILIEQYLDFVVNRTFRQSLLVHAERSPQIRYQPDRSRYARMHFAAWVPPVDGPTLMDHSRQEYQQAEDSTLFTNDPGIKAALDALSARWPSTLSRQELVDDVHARLVSAGLRPTAELSEVVDNLVQLLIFQGQASFRLDPVLPEPAAGRLRLDEPARRMAELTGGDADGSTFTRWHETVPLSPLDRHLLPLLDGTRDRDALVDALLAAVLSESSSADPGDTPAPDEAELRAGVAEYVDAAPRRLIELKLLRPLA